MRSRLFQKTLAQEGVDLALLIQMMDVYYFTGTLQPGYLAMAPDRDPVFFVRKAYDRALEETRGRAVEVLFLESPKDLPKALEEMGFPLPGTLGLELDIVPYLTADRLGRLFPGAHLKDVGARVRHQRAVKDDEEIALIKKAGVVWQKTMEAVRLGFRPRMDEYDLALEVEAVARRAGHQGLIRTRALDFEIFLGHLLTGPHGAVPTRFDGPTGGPGTHPALAQGSAHRLIEKGDPVLADYASAADGYVYDGTRTFVHGQLSQRLEKAYKVAQEVHALVREEMRTGKGIGDLTSRVWEFVRGEGLTQHFMGYDRDRVKFLGHGVGLELDEFPVLTQRETGLFQTGMVVAVEPKFVFPGEGAVGLESTYRVHGGEPEVLAPYDEGVIPLGTKP